MQWRGGASRAGTTSSGGSGQIQGRGASASGAAAAAPPPAPAPAPPRSQDQQQPQVPGVRLHPLTLSFGDAGLNAAYAAQTANSQLAFDRGSHGFHVAVSLLHCGYSAYTATGSLLSRAALSLTLPYLAAAALHWRLSGTRLYERRRLAALLCMEALYVAVCVSSMPRWVLAPPTTWRTYLRNFVLGTGVLISAWATAFCVKPVFVVHYLTIPLEYVVQTVALTRPVCAALTSTPYGRDATARIAAALDAAAAAAAVAEPACPARAGPRAAAPEASCAGVVVAWQLLCCCGLLYLKYRLERSARIKWAEASGAGRAKRAWPPVPAGVQAAVHVLIALQAAVALWSWLGCAPRS